ncbi:MFS transporter [bacterium]|nr:MFS transporter [bacterium]
MTESIKKSLRDHSIMRWFVLILISGLTFGTYWFQDFFSGLKPLMEATMGLSSTDFGKIISSTTWANMVGMIILGGIFLDKFGIRLSGIVFGTLATIGAAVTALAASGAFGKSQESIMISMMVGRILFGIGLETVCVIISRTVVKWFKGYELALAMGINVAFGRFGTAFGTAFSPDIARAYGSIPPAINFAATLVGLGVLFFLVYLIFDIKVDKQLAVSKVASDEEKFQISDLFKLVTDRSFIFITLLCVAFYSAVFPFIQYAPDLLVNKFGFTAALPDLTNASFWEKLTAWFHNGAKVTSLIPLGTIIFTPIFGSIVDKKGKAASLMMIGSLLLIFAHISLSVFNSVTLGYFGLFSLGIAFALVPAAMWPSVAKIVPEYRLGTAYATMFTVQNWGLGAFFWGIGKVVDMVNPTVIVALQDAREKLVATGVSSVDLSQRIEEMKLAGQLPVYNYTIPILMLVGLGVLSIILSYMLKKSDEQQGYGLELPSNETTQA